MVAAAAMAGVPLLNGFLSKEMFFAEAVETHDGSLLDRSMPYVALARQHLRASPIRCASSTRLLRPAGRPTCRESRTSRRSWMRLPVEFLVVDLPRGRHRAGA